jgi:hypothetical protein
MNAGRPTKFKEEYCEQLIDHMNSGLSFESFGGVIEVAVSTLYKWAEDHKIFSEAKAIGFQKSRFFWEKIGIQQAQDGQGNATAFVFNMKNRFPAEWRDKQEVQQDTRITVVPDYSDGD